MVTRLLGGAAVAAAITFTLVSAARADRQSAASGRATAQQVREAYAQGGLRAAAGISGHYRSMVPGTSDMQIQDLEALVRISDLVIVGQVGENRSHLSTDERQLTTDFKVQVLDVLGGSDRRSVEQVVLSTPGGKVEFEDGTSAEQVARSFVMPRAGARYLLFLQAQRPEHISQGQADWSRGTQGLYHPAAGAAGVYELAGDDTVRAASKKGDPVVKFARGKLAGQLLGEVRRAVALAGKRP
jgi:hypothetical protein